MAFDSGAAYQVVQSNNGRAYYLQAGAYYDTVTLAQSSAPEESSVSASVLIVGASREVSIFDDGKILVATAAEVTISVPEGLGTSLGCVIKGHSDGTTIIDPLGTVTINGATASITIPASTYVGLQCPGALNVFDAVGV